MAAAMTCVYACNGTCHFDQPPGTQQQTTRMSAWFVYLIECRGGSVYTGITTDVERRYAQHVAGTGARYTRAWPPVRLLGVRAFPDRSSASKAEYAVKQLPPDHKRRWCGSPQPELC